MCGAVYVFENYIAVFVRSFFVEYNFCNARVVDATVPLANMFGYVNTLRSMSQGRAQYTMQFAHYADVPQMVADEIKAKVAG